jgi:phage I-like protein
VKKNDAIVMRGPGVALPAAAVLPEWVHLQPFGEWRGHPVGPFFVNQQVADEIVAHFNAYGIDLVIDYEHQTQATEWNGQPAPAAGWIDQLEVRDNGVWGHVREWTEKAAAFLAAREYRYLSPVLCLGSVDKKTGQRGGARLASVALTNIPFLTDELVPVVNRQSSTETSMNLLASLIALYALADTATEAEVLDRVKAEHEALVALQGDGSPITVDDAAAMRTDVELGALTRAELKWGNKPPADAKVVLQRTLKHSGYVSYDEHARALAAAGEQADAVTDAQLVERAMSEGKVTAAVRAWFEGTVKTDRHGAETWLASAPVIVPMAGRTPRSPSGGGANGGGLSTEEQAVCRQLGLTPAQFRAQAQ